MTSLKYFLRADLLRMCLTIWLLALTGCSITHAMRIGNGQRIGVDQMIAEVSSARLIFVGEYHDETSHHELQRKLIQDLYNAGEPLAIGLEMFRIDSQPALDDWISGKITETEFARIYQQNWRNLNWSLYRDIFLFARDHGIPMVALNVPQPIIETVTRTGFSGLSTAELRALPPRSTDPITEQNSRFMAAYYPSHGKNDVSFHYLCEAQVLRNRVMARAIIRYQGNHPHTKMIILAGAAHVWKSAGIPAELGDVPYKVIMPPFPGVGIGTDDQDTGGADYILD